MTGGDNWGPFSPAISHAEQVARLRTLRAFVQVLQPDKLHPLIKKLWLAESGDAAELEAARVELDRLPALTRRKVLGCWAYALTLGLVALVVNGALFMLTSWIAGELDLQFHVDEFWPTAVLGALLIAVVSWLLNLVVPDRKGD